MGKMIIYKCVCNKEFPKSKLKLTTSLRYDDKTLYYLSCPSCGGIYFTIQPDGYHWKGKKKRQEKGLDKKMLKQFKRRK